MDETIIPFKKSPRLIGDWDALDFYRRQRRFLSHNDSKFSYIESGLRQDTSIVFVHSAFAPAFSWRKVMKKLEEEHHCIAPDLLGLNSTLLAYDKEASILSSARSDKQVPIGRGYRYAQQQSYFDEFMRFVVNSENIVIVAQGGGSVLAGDWMRRHPLCVRGFVHSGGLFCDESLTGTIVEKKISDFYLELIALIEKEPASLRNTVTSLTASQLSNAAYLEYEKKILHKAPISKTMSLLQLLPSSDLDPEAFRSIIRYTEWLRTTSIPKLKIETSRPHPILKLYSKLSDHFDHQSTTHVEGPLLTQEIDPSLLARKISSWLNSI